MFLRAYAHYYSSTRAGRAWLLFLWHLLRTHTTFYIYCVLIVMFLPAYAHYYKREELDSAWLLFT